MAALVCLCLHPGWLDFLRCLLVSKGLVGSPQRHWLDAPHAQDARTAWNSHFLFRFAKTNRAKGNAFLQIGGAGRYFFEHDNASARRIREGTRGFESIVYQPDLCRSEYIRQIPTAEAIATATRRKRLSI